MTMMVCDSIYRFDTVYLFGVFLLSSVPDPMFDQIMYIVPEDDPGSVSLCVNISVNIFEPLTYTIATAQKFPAEAEGKSIGYIISSIFIILNQILTLQVELTSQYNLLDQ